GRGPSVARPPGQRHSAVVARGPGRTLAVVGGIAMRWATLPEYAAWVLAQPLNLLRGIPHETYHLGDIVAFVMHREPPFQTELVHLLPRGRESGNEVGEHVHPHVEGLEYIIYGELYFTLAGKPLCDPRLVKKFARGAGKWRF